MSVITLPKNNAEVVELPKTFDAPHGANAPKRRRQDLRRTIFCATII